MPSPFDQQPYRVRLDWGPVGGEAVAAGATFAVVVDVLSFTTTLSVAADLGIEVLPFPWKDESAAAYARAHGAALAVGRLEAARHAGGAVSLSPVSLRSAGGPGRIVLPSPNGSTTSFLLRDSGARVVGAALRNATAVARWLAGRLLADPHASVAVVAAGERWPDGSLRPCLEDHLGAGAVLAGLQDAGVAPLSPEAAAAAAAYRHTVPRLRETVLACASGRELAERGFGADVEVASEVDSSVSVPVLRGGSFTEAAGFERGSGG